MPDSRSQTPAVIVRLSYVSVSPSPPTSARIVFLHAALFLILVCVSVLYGRTAQAADKPSSSWSPVIADHPAIPPYLIAVDKSRQELAFFERRSPLSLSRKFACTTGQAIGDKSEEGDLKTPEGIYFVVRHIGTGLDFIKYGHEAYTLNYPNPIDRLRKKTGHGIWIHGRGEPLVPLQTEGCVSMNNDDLTLLRKVLSPGTPVALTESFAHKPSLSPEDSDTASVLKNKVEAWAAAWSSRSQEYFDFYDKNAYSIAQGEAFSAFQAQKERLFARLPWIRTTVRDIQVLQGPDYWVTWFYQDYQAPNLSTRGVRRLYWSKDTGGQFKILGMEWNPGLDTSTLLASTEPLLPPREQQDPVWPGGLPDLGTLPRPFKPDALLADSGQSSGTSSSSTGGNALPEGALPAPPPSAQETVAQARHASSADHAENPKAGVMARPSEKAMQLGRILAPENTTLPLASTPQSEVATGSSSRLSLPPPLPTQGLAPFPSQTMPSPVIAERPPLRVTAPHPSPSLPAESESETRERASEPQSDIPGAEAPVSSVASTSAPTSTPVPSPDQGNAPWLTAEAQSPGEPPAAPVRQTDDPVQTQTLLLGKTEEWRVAWESGDIDRYMSFYAPKATQGSRTSAASIRKQKERLWDKAAPSSVLLSGVTVTVEGDTAVARMRQKYLDSRAKGDEGLKTLTFTQRKGQWLITQEDWSPLTDEARN